MKLKNKNLISEKQNIINNTTKIKELFVNCKKCEFTGPSPEGGIDSYATVVEATFTTTPTQILIFRPDKIVLPHT